MIRVSQQRSCLFIISKVIKLQLLEYLRRRMVFFDREFEGWRTTECGLFHCMFKTKEEAEEKERRIKEDKKKKL